MKKPIVYITSMTLVVAAVGQACQGQDQVEQCQAYERENQDDAPQPPRLPYDTFVLPTTVSGTASTTSPSFSFSPSPSLEIP
jgi:hypothetical protein